MSGALLHAALIKLGFLVDVDFNNNSFVSIEEDGQTTTGNLRMQTDGTWVWTGDIFGSNENGSWGTPTTTDVGDDYHTRLVFVSGNNNYFSGAALNTWLPLTANVQWNFRKLSSGGPDQTIGTFRLDLSDDGGSTTLDDSGNFTVRMEEQSP